MQGRYQQPLPPAVDSLEGGVAVAEPPPRSRPERKAVTAGRALPRLYVIDGIRLVAALMVALHHYVGTSRVDRPGNAFWGRPVSEIMPTVFRFASFGWIGVEIFFVISGFVICMSCWGRTPKDFFVSRVIRLYPAYWVAVALTVVVLVALPGVWGRPQGRDILLNLTMLQSGSGVANVDAVYWTLWSELRFYLLFMVMVAMGLTYRTVFLLVMVAVALGFTDHIRWKWLVTAGCLTYPLYLMHYAIGTTLISRLHDAMDARLLVALVITGFLVLSWLVHRLVERPAARLLKRGLESSFTRLRSFGHMA
ncbi:acyltransferase [Streptomyces sp900116325]|uniref:acyltransferase family protein n=1 Tax=Streptomyces sp. 900116325 TaxID=3154295 RepID=UPI0033A6A952